MEEIYDQFPINILEMGGRIERKPIGFMIHNVKAYLHGVCIRDKKMDGVVKGEIVDDEMHVELRCMELDEYVENHLQFSEISLNRDRILWSNGLFEGGYSPRITVPAFLSLFFQMGDLRKVQFSNQSLLIEFYGTTLGYDVYDEIIIMTEIEILAQKAVQNIEKEQISVAKIWLSSIYEQVSKEPSYLCSVENYGIVGKAFLLMILNRLSDDIDTLQTMSSIAYLCLSKAMEIEGDNPNLYKDRLLVLNSAYNSFKYTVMSVLAEEEVTDGFASLMFQSRADIKSRDAIWQMEIADMERYPIICSSFSYFAERKNFLLDKIERQFFLPAKNLNEVVKQGKFLHERTYKYLVNKILINRDIDF